MLVLRNLWTKANATQHIATINTNSEFIAMVTHLSSCRECKKEEKKENKMSVVHMLLLIVDRFNGTVVLIMNKHKGTVLQSTSANTFKFQWCLYWLIAKASSGTIERLSILMESTQEEHSVVKACESKARQSVDHVLTKVLTITTLKLLRLC